MTTNVEPILTTRNLVKRYGRVTALDHCNFDLYPNEILAVIGDNGAGKSTLIKAICGAVTPDEGEIRLDGKPVHFKSPLEARNAGIETVYQNLALSPALSIADNMFMGREIRMPGPLGSVLKKLDHKAMEKIARDKLTELGLMTIQNIRQAVETQGEDRTCRFTVSIGIAERREGEDKDAWFRRADQALYQAKNQGKNRVSVAT